MLLMYHWKKLPLAFLLAGAYIGLKRCFDLITDRMAKPADDKK